MLPLIHGKDLLERAFEDLQSIMNDIACRESEYCGQPEESVRGGLRI